ncbi:SDR family oxidoreductase [Paenibacillus silvae]|uniref:SDR family oxidoreductase n=3 Tax=Paenibacillus TaxID=44249 RepID=A0A5M9WKL5_PAEAM|nr:MULTISPECIES: SDR family oxidoreductase [Paenibacillus]PWW44229.1 NAD(P)-dependent dehydrogenase (short-subunit alcohol dehydrogenase family) [Paenibacillus pabuli]PXW10258.1 NAD(P)-dependent dehydrogenase (short-subunit alcohol dehydrogenase family) [Paenibacillus taichungensis]QLG42822.1 SDR family oxidoreductase [Paenibacillus sp. E222]KAA8782370.1 SDR family oxidoreductase [Paenibacillus amylolyticus]MDM5276695.1 SDR family oxidoreductase [Paenibacillus silvae]
MKIAIVTGGSNGIGKATALELGKRGISVILTYNSYKDRAEAVVKEVEQNTGVRAVALKLNLTQISTFEGFALEVKQYLNDIWDRTTFDYLVNNGGIGGPMMFNEMTEEYFDNILNTNFKGPVFLTQHLVRFMDDHGAIVNTTSSSKNQSFPGYSAYGSLKAAFSTWTRYIAKELAPRNIRVNAVSPGPTHSNFGDGVFDKHPEFIKPLAEQSVFGRIGQPEDLAKVIVNVLSDDFGWVTAQDIEVSGGHLL